MKENNEDEAPTLLKWSEFSSNKKAHFPLGFLQARFLESLGSLSSSQIYSCKNQYMSLTQ